MFKNRLSDHASVDAFRQNLPRILKVARPGGSEAVAMLKAELSRLGFAYVTGGMLYSTSSNPETLLTAHSDTVDRHEGEKSLQWSKGEVIGLRPGSRGSCLGADCGTGVALLLGMIDRASKDPRLALAIFDEEETGGIGSRDFVDAYEVDTLKHVISLDRAHSGSIITHQSGSRCCSQTFAHALKSQLDGLGIPSQPDSGGTFTDSAMFTGKVSECTNLSVGYARQHSTSETQNVPYAVKLLEALQRVDFAELPTERDPKTKEYGWSGGYSRYMAFDPWEVDEIENEARQTVSTARANLERELTGMKISDLAEFLSEYGIDWSDVAAWKYETQEWSIGR